MGWGEDFSQEFNPNKKFRLDCSNAIISHRPVLDIASDAIHRITNKYPGPYTLFCTGGIDSQAMAYCWLKSGVPFNIVSFTYNSNLNDFDLVDLYEFSRIHNLKVNVIDFDMLDFLENRREEYQHKYQCISPQITAYMAMSETVQTGTVFFSGNFLTPTDSFLDYTILGLHRYVKQTNRAMVPFFFLHDAELAPAFVPVMASMSFGKTKSDALIYKGYTSRVKIYQKAGIPVIFQLNKFSGFEKIKEYYGHAALPSDRKERIKFLKLPSRMTFDIEFRYKMKELIKYQEHIDYVFDVKI